MGASDIYCGRAVLREELAVAGKKARILLLMGDALERRGVKAELVAAGFEVRTRANAFGLDRLISGYPPDLVILNTRFDKGPDGLETGRRLREVAGACIIYIAEAKADDECLPAFEAGGDDYVQRSVPVAELRARVEAVLKRAGLLRDDPHFGDIAIDYQARTVTRAGQRVDLTPSEFDIFALLTRRPGQVVSKSQLAGHLRGRAMSGSNVLEVHMSSLRKKLEVWGPRCIHTRRGAGYAFVPPGANDA